MKTNSSINNINKNSAIVHSRFSAINLEKIAKATGFSERKARKITPRDLLTGFFLMALSRGRNSFESWASKIGFLIGDTLSKQALWKRIQKTEEDEKPKGSKKNKAKEKGKDKKEDGKKVSLEFLGRVLDEVMKKSLLSGAAIPLKGFKKIFLHDSIHIKLDRMLSGDFPGSINQNKETESSTLKLQVIYDLVTGSFRMIDLSNYRQNDQKKAWDILDIAEKGDLILRDLGYFVLDLFNEMIEKGIYFISRLRYGLNIYDVKTNEKINLLKLLKQKGSLDMNVLLGSEARVPVRLVAVKVSNDEANERRRKARLNHDKRNNHSKEYYELLGWDILITNCPKAMLSRKDVLYLYGLRFRIEVIFKSWKSYFKIKDALEYKTKLAVEIYIYCMLIFIILFQVSFLKYLEKTGHSEEEIISLLKYSKFIADNLIILFIAEALGTDISRLFLKLLFYYTPYQKRHDRMNYHDKLAKLS
ncbi:MAG: IS4 family transposase [Acidobacteriota bacterium]